MNKKLRADLFLLLATLIWGATFPLVTAALPFMDPFLFVLIRFVIAGLFFLIWIFPKFKYTDKKVLWAGLILGLLNAIAYLGQTFGMQTVDADTSAFIATTGVVLVPFIAPILGLARVKKIEVLGSFLCLWGLYVLTGAHLQDLSTGQFWILFSTLGWAGGVCYLQRVAPKIKEGALLAFYQIVFLIPVALILSGIHSEIPHFQPILIFALLYTGILATAVVFLIQVRYQKETTATHAAIIYSLEPVLASLIAMYVNHEALTARVVKGGGIILLSILLIELMPRVLPDSKPPIN